MRQSLRRLATVEELQAAARPRNYRQTEFAPRATARGKDETMNPEIPATPVVRQLAERLGVDLRNVVGTGVAGRIRREDVQAAADDPPTASTAGTSSRRAVCNPYARAGGNLPAFTASGLDPAALLAFPAPVRPAMAAASTQAEAYRLGQRYEGLSDLQAATALLGDPNVSGAALNAAYEVLAANTDTAWSNGQSRIG